MKTLADFKRDMLTEQIPIKYCGSCDLYLASLDQLKTIICCTRLGPSVSFKWAYWFNLFRNKFKMQKLLANTLQSHLNKVNNFLHEFQSEHSFLKISTTGVSNFLHEFPIFVPLFMWNIIYLKEWRSIFSQCIIWVIIFLDYYVFCCHKYINDRQTIQISTYVYVIL